MARPFPNTFDNGGSSMSPQAGSNNTPISYRANVNRQKTKKWTMAAAVDYGGDDWGDDDDYEYDPSPPPPVPKPTGLRQQGQALPNANVQRVEPPLPPVDNTKKAYGGLPALPGASNTRGRSNSFDADEERNFSNSAIRQEPPSAATFPLAQGQRPATRFSQITGMPSTRQAGGAASPPGAAQGQQLPKTGLRKASQSFSPISESPVTSPSQSATLSTGEVTSASPRPTSVVSAASDNRVPSGDYQAQRDFSPSAVPPPLSTRASPAPQAAADTPSATAKFPARKSSLGQSSAPNLSDIMQRSQQPTSQKLWTADRSSSPGVAARSSTVDSVSSAGQPPAADTDATSHAKPAAKALPFIRPADIYKRIEAEREKARQSTESSRPSMDSILGPGATDKPEEPPVARPLREKSSYENLSSTRHRASIEADESIDSGRRLMPMLESVKERKSEYGFDGFNVNEQAGQHAAENHDLLNGPGAADPVAIDTEIPRTKSVSPTLPSLNRISGFGIDMFSNAKPEDQGRAAPKSIDTTPSSQTAESTLHSQPSLGFRSVVHQAFDTNEDTSVPDTPASQTGSGVRRSDTESTGTSGISPIMSRVPSGATAETRNRDLATPSILEVVHEPSSLAGSSAATSYVALSEPVPQHPQPVPGFKPGHRRDISTPSPRNSPARSLDLTNSTTNLQAQEAIVSDSHPTNNDSAHLQTPVSGAQSGFRPSLPGGWTSYATTETSNTTQPVAARPAATDAEIHERGSDDDLNITPTTTKHSLPQSSLEASMAAVGLTEATGGAIETAGGRSTEFEQSSAVPTIMPGNDNLPTPDNAMAPAGNIYSKAALDPRVLPKLDHAPLATQLRPDTVNLTPAASSEGPTPPLKDTPGQDQTSSAEHLSQTARPLKSGAPVAEEIRPESQVLPTFSVDSQHEDVDSKRDSMRPVSQFLDASRDDRARLSSQLGNGGFGGPGRESTYLPREYDNYWASTAEEQEPIATSSRSAVENQNINSSTVGKPPGELQSQPTALPSVANVGQEASKPVASRLQHRFSWERSTETVPEVVPKDTSAQVSDQHHDAVVSEALPIQDSPTFPPGAQKLFSESEMPEHIPEAVDGPVHNENQVERSASPPTVPHPDDSQTGRDAGALSGASALGTDDLSLRLSQAEDINPLGSYPVSPSRVTDEPSQPSPSTVSPINSALPPPPSQAGRILAFKEIVGLKTQQERIRTFDDIRNRYAAMNSGLDDWMVTLKAQHPEHADVTGLWVGGQGGARSSKPIPAGAASSQQPYYQQYLNASSPGQANLASKPGPGVPSPGGQQGFSPGGGNKITSQQVQAKGKELLHTAGVFGGKAGKAGKGLLAKGKSRLRGGGDKTDSPTKSKADRRTSWGIPTSLSRSSGRQQQESPVLRIEQQEQATPRTSQQTFSTQRSAYQSEDSFGMSRDFSHVSPPISRHGESIASREVFDADKSPIETESADRSGMAAPIGAPMSKYNPSWDPSQSVPTAEEGVGYDEQQNEHPSAPRPASHLAALAVPGVPVMTGEQFNDQQETRFYSSEEEEPAISNDWVAVPPELSAEDEGLARSELPDSQPPDISAASAPNGSQGNTSEELPRLPPQITPLGNITHSGTTSYEPEPAPAEVAPEPVSQQQSSTTSFLPPIRRTSTFGLKLGSRPKKPRFPIEDDDVSDLEADDPVPGDDNADLAAEASAAADGSGRDGVSGVVSPATVASTAEPIVLAEPREIPHEQVPTPEPAPSRPEVFPQAEPQEIPYEQAPIAETALPRSEVMQQQRVESREIPYQQTPAPQNLPSEAQPMQPGPSGYNQPAVISRPGPGPSFVPPHPSGVQPDDPVPRSSQDSWRPNIVPSHPNPPQNQYHEEQPQPSARPPIPRNSWEPQRGRGLSGSSQQLANRPDGNWVGPPQPRPFEQPPSSAQRYPDLFRADAGPDAHGDDNDLPAHYYQQPIPREASFLPRQQTNEYQLPGVGPPIEEPPSAGSKRNSGFFKELGRGISNSTIRDRSGSRSQGRGPPSPGRPLESRGNEYADSIVASDDGRERRNQSSFFGGLSRTSTGGLAPPRSRDSMVAHHSQSRTDLLAFEQPPPPSPDKKRFLFGGSSGDLKPKFNKLARASSSVTPEDPGKKKRFSGLGSLFGKSGTISARASLPPPQRPQPIKEISYGERQPIESPQFDPRAPSGFPRNSNNRPHLQGSSTWTNGSSSQSKSLLAKFRQPQTAAAPPQESRKDSKAGPRRTSAAGLLNGFISRGSNQQEGERDDSSRSEGSQQLQPLPRAQTYTDLQETPQPQPQPYIIPGSSQGPPQVPMHQKPRIRRPGREPKYDLVPIPGGYSLVRGQGAMAAPTDYDPRGLNRPQQADPQYMFAQAGNPQQYHHSPQPYLPQPHNPNQYSYAPSQRQTPQDNGYPPRDSPAVQENYIQPASEPQHQIPEQQQEQQQQPRQQPRQKLQQQPEQQPDPPLSDPEPRGRPRNLETFEGRAPPRRLSREDLVARSPARTPDGQQTPYKLTLPNENNGEADHSRPVQKDLAIDANGGSQTTPVAAKPQHDSIQRLQQPVIRHPGSPATYTVPDTVFSPINPSAENIPPPPPPESQSRSQPQSHLNSQQRPSHAHSHSQNDSLNISIDLDRSNTVGSGASQVSKLSGHPDERTEDRAVSTAEEKKMGAVRNPSPPSPAVTPERLESPVLPPEDAARGRTERKDKGGNDLLERTVMARGSSPNLYDASPRLPKTTKGPVNHGRDDLIVDTNLSSVAKAPDATPTTSTPKASGTENTPTNRRRAKEQEEKIVYHGDYAGIETVPEEEAPVTMSATSYPGQEWNPYMGAFDDGFD